MLVGNGRAYALPAALTSCWSQKSHRPSTFRIAYREPLRERRRFLAPETAVASINSHCRGFSIAGYSTHGSSSASGIKISQHDFAPGPPIDLRRFVHSTAIVPYSQGDCQGLGRGGGTRGAVTWVRADEESRVQTIGLVDSRALSVMATRPPIVSP